MRTLRSALDSSGSCNGALSPPTTPNPTSAVCPPDDSLAAAGQHFLPGPLCAEPTLVLHQAYTNDSSFKWCGALNGSQHSCLSMLVAPGIPGFTLPPLPSHCTGLTDKLIVGLGSPQLLIPLQHNTSQSMKLQYNG
ncbi:hypothetical protein QQF64_012300 [Cirrhinus molitorella]|uniref:Uncharacterized protein n=1 Tax=Cirrhinus molitorella TaxID=172907 RepID=A0ABR3LW83_9TELE